MNRTQAGQLAVLVMQNRMTWEQFEFKFWHTAPHYFNRDDLKYVYSCADIPGRMVLITKLNNGFGQPVKV